jgi:hypothetical protein
MRVLSTRQALPALAVAVAVDVDVDLDDDDDDDNVVVVVSTPPSNTLLSTLADVKTVGQVVHYSTRWWAAVLFACAEKAATW